MVLDYRGGEDIAFTASKYGVHITTLRYWDKKLRKDLGKPKPSNGAGARSWITRRRNAAIKTYRFCPHCGEALR
jgi:transposase-like protein